MPHYKAPIKDINFAFRTLFDMNEIRGLPNFSDVTNDLINALIEECAKIAENELFPLNISGDQEGCSFNNGKVKTPKGFIEVYKKFAEIGCVGLTFDKKYGGQGLPQTVDSMIEEIFCSANVAFTLYLGLTKGACKLITSNGSQQLQEKYLPKLIDGTWGGTMNLTEENCGTDLGLLRTMATLQKDGSYKITGTKIFISSGEHDLTENIIHLVLARTPDAPEGVKGLSLFVVPKILINDDGTLAQANNVKCSAIEHKMGIKASSTCVMNYEAAQGWILGELNEGLDHMFVMMNFERLCVGIQALGVAEVAYQNALLYAKERLQGRSLTGAKHLDKPADPLIVHPDIRKMLLTMKVFNEGCRMLSAWTARSIDIAKYSTNIIDKTNAENFIQIITPIVKAFFTDTAFEVTNLAIQVHGGYGYISDYGIEQYLRDVRITSIYEGTNGIQALDLVGRKIGYNMGKYLRSFFIPVQEFINNHKDNKDQSEFIIPLQKVFSRLQRASIFIAQQGLKNPDQAGAAASDFLNLFGYTALAYLWAKAAFVAQEKLETDENFYNGKICTARFYMQKILPRTSSLFAMIMAGSDSLMQIKEEEFC